MSPCIWHRRGALRAGGRAAPTCSEDGQGEVGDGFPGVGLGPGPALPRPQDGQGARVAVAAQQLAVLVAEDIQGGLQTGCVPRLDHLLHQLQGRKVSTASAAPCVQPSPRPCSLGDTAHRGVAQEALARGAWPTGGVAWGVAWGRPCPGTACVEHREDWGLGGVSAPPACSSLLRGVGFGVLVSLSLSPSL